MKRFGGICLVAGSLIAGRAHSPALEPDAVRIRISVKRVLSPTGALPTGNDASSTEITRVIGKCNDSLERSGASWTLVLTEVKDSRAASSFYVMSAGEVANLESQARADPAGYLWRTDAINIYVVDQITNAGGVCSFPTSGPHRDTIVINSQSILGGAEGWLHEMGHYFNLIHPHEDDQVADTIFDPPLPDPFDCGVHDQNFVNQANADGALPIDIQRGLHNVMGYHCDPTILTPLQVIRMRRALLDYRLPVMETPPEGPPPVAEVRLPEEAAGGRVSLAGGSAAVTLDGSFSRDGSGGAGLTCRWSLLEGPAGGARFESSASGWARGCSGLGYGDDDDLTELNDMRNRYLAVYATSTFDLVNTALLRALELDISYDDGFAAYLNDVEVARRNLPQGAGPSTPTQTSREEREVIDLSAFLNALLPGRNRLSIEIHNSSLDSSDLSLHPVLSARNLNGTVVPLIPSRAVWSYRKGSEGAPPADWKAPEFDAGASRMRVAFTRPGLYRFRLTVDEGLPPGNTDTEDVTLLVVPATDFVRGDCNSDGQVDLSDALKGLFSLFDGSVAAPCPDACDSNDDEAHDIADPIALLEFLFRAGPPPPPPFPAIGPDPAGDALRCG